MDEYQMEFAAGFGESYQNCPACGKEMVAGHSECFSCGVVVDRFQDRMSTNQIQNKIGGIDHLTSLDLKRLDKKWKQVVVNYHDQEGHHDFIGHCQKKGALPFAIHHYSRMLEIDKEDDIADSMRRQALTRLTFATEVVESPSVPPVMRRLDRFARLAIGIGIFLSSLAIVTGALNPDMRNLIGLGVSFLALFLALSIYRRP